MKTRGKSLEQVASETRAERQRARIEDSKPWRAMRADSGTWFVVDRAERLLCRVWHDDDHGTIAHALAGAGQST